MSDTIEGLAADVVRAVEGKDRFILGIAGPPASGKSYLAERLAAAIPQACALPMDGFHLDDGVLERHGTRDRKGAPHTFDVAGFAALLKRARVEPDFYAPGFDRELEISRAGAIEVSGEARILIVEGNWLLLDAPGWGGIKGLFDQVWFLDVATEVIETRLRERWRAHGRSDADAAAWIANNDMPNVALVQSTAKRADRIVTLA